MGKKYIKILKDEAQNFAYSKVGDIFEVSYEAIGRFEAFPLIVENSKLRGTGNWFFDYDQNGKSWEYTESPSTQTTPDKAENLGGKMLHAYKPGDKAVVLKDGYSFEKEGDVIEVTRDKGLYVVANHPNSGAKDYWHWDSH